MSLNRDRLKALAQATCGLLVVVDHRSPRPHLRANEAGHDFILGEPPECMLSLLYATLTTQLSIHMSRNNWWTGIRDARNRLSSGFYRCPLSSTATPPLPVRDLAYSTRLHLTRSSEQIAVHFQYFGRLSRSALPSFGRPVYQSILG